MRQMLFGRLYLTTLDEVTADRNGGWKFSVVAPAALSDVTQYK